MNRPLRKVAVALLSLFGLLLLNANWVQVVKGDSYRDNPRNSRVLLRTYSIERGPIAVLGDDGRSRVPLASSRATGGTLKYLRTYQDGAPYAHVTGFYSLVYGRTGIERSEDQVLSGDDDRLFVRRLSDYVTGREPSGGGVVLTLNDAAQRAAFEGLGDQRGAVVALDPRTGEVLALVSTPSYDPARLSSFDTKAIRSYYEQLINDDQDPLLNRAINQLYPPGSTFKVVTTAAALSSGDYQPDTQIPSPPQLTLPQTSQTLKNFAGEQCSGATSTLAEALRVSCNTAFGQLGLDLGADALREQAQAFGFGSDELAVPTRVDASRFPDDPNPPQTAQSAIGQFDVRVTPLQMAMVAAGVANKGEVMSPYLVREVTAPDESRLDRAEPQVLNRAVSEQVAAQLTTMMQAVVDSGTGTAAQINGIPVAGKTGTAQNARGAAPHAWFIGFAPADDPQVAVAVLVENGGNVGQSATGGAVAAPIAQRVMRAVLGR